MSNTNVEALKALCKKITNYDSSGLSITEVIDDIESHYDGGATLSEPTSIAIDSTKFRGTIEYSKMGNNLVYVKIDVQTKIELNISNTNGWNSIYGLTEQNGVIIPDELKLRGIRMQTCAAVTGSTSKVPYLIPVSVTHEYNDAYSPAPNVNQPAILTIGVHTKENLPATRNIRCWYIYPMKTTE